MNTLVAQERTDVNKSTMKTLRNDGEIPAIVYGREMDTKSIFIKFTDLRKVIRDVGRNGIIALDLNGKSKNVIVRDYQSNPVTKDILHVDFLQVNKDTEIDTSVSVILKGTSNGEKAGGITKQFLHELNITANVNDIPDSIEIDITNFEIGHTVQIADIKKDYSTCTFKHEDEEAIMMVDYVKAVTEEDADIEVPAV